MTGRKPDQSRPATGRCHPGRATPVGTALVALLPALSPAIAGATPEPSLPGPAARLAAAIERYRALAEGGGWPAVGPGTLLREGDSGTRVARLRARLEATGDVEPGAGPRDLLDGALVAAVRRFQMRHGLEVDGVVGPRTLAALDVPAGERVETLERNLRRIAEAPPPAPGRRLVVNVPAYELRFLDGDTEVLTSRVIVGLPGWRTPRLAGSIERIVVNPPWNVPRSIQLRELIPRIRKEPDYLRQEGFTVIAPSGGAVDPSSVDWWGPEARAIRLRQEPGPTNALGDLKLEFDNPYRIYLHDSPWKRLFERPVRALSHGCIRVERAFELATLFLGSRQAWRAEALRAAIASGETRTIRVADPVALDIVYRTAWVDPSGTVHFRRDVYGLDEPPVGAEGHPSPGQDSPSFPPGSPAGGG